MRIVAGAFGGRKLHAPTGSATRPTSDRVKEALFSILGPPRPRDGAPFRVLDLFAGSGALGLEAVSRGADQAVLVEQEPSAADAAERNIEVLGLSARVRLVRRDAGAALRQLDGRFDWIFADPPYDRPTDRSSTATGAKRAGGGGALDRALRLLGGAALVAPSAVVIAEHDGRNPPGDRYGALHRDDLRRWGDTAISFYRIEGSHG